MAARLEQDKPDDVISLDDCLIRSAEQQQQARTFYSYIARANEVLSGWQCVVFLSRDTVKSLRTVLQNRRRSAQVDCGHEQLSQEV